MGGQPWQNLAPWKAPWGACQRGGKGEGEEGEGAWLGRIWGAPWGGAGCKRGAQTVGSYDLLHSIPEEELNVRKKKRRKERRKIKEKKEKIWKIFQI
jgi:hypothetical protein